MSNAAVLADSAGMGHRFGSSGSVLVLNATYEPINVCSLRRAAILVLKSKAIVLEQGVGAMHSEQVELPNPAVIRLSHYVKLPRDLHRRRITRRAVFARDSWTCQYCGRGGQALTVDHVIPRSKGGRSVWENIVASCAGCNRRKADKLPKEARMHPRTRPAAPGPNVFVRIAAPRVPGAWKPYLEGALPL